MKHETQQQSLFHYRTNALSSYGNRNRGHYRRLALVATLLGGIGFLTFY